MMKKSLIIASALGAISAVSSGAALANTGMMGGTSTYCKTGFYVGVQGGRTETYYRPGNVLAQAASNENYLANPYTNTVTTDNSNGSVISNETTLNGSYGALTQTHVDDIGIGGRLFAGYQFTPYFAAEIGATQYGKTTFTATGVNVHNVYISGNTRASQVGSRYYGPAVVTNTDKYTGEVTEHSVDLVAKGTLPLQYGFGVYAKAGMAYITAQRSINAVYNTSTSTNYLDDGVTETATPGSLQSESNIYTQNYQAVRPTYGVGIDYTIPGTPMDLDISWTRVQGIGGGIPNADLAAVGLAYKFA